MVLIDLDAVNKNWKKEIQDYRKELQKKGLSGEALRIMVNIMNKYREDAINIMLKLEQNYERTLLDGALSSKMVSKIKKHVVNDKKNLTQKEFDAISKKAIDEIAKEIGDTKSKPKKSFSKYKK